VVATKDFHIDPGAHFSDHPDYASSWPRHCVATTPGAEFHPDLDTDAVEAVFRKGAHAAAYSGFEGADDRRDARRTWLRTRTVDAVDVVGIATDYCVRATAADAVANGFTTRVLLDLTAGVAPDSIEALTALRAAGVELVADQGARWVPPGIPCHQPNSRWMRPAGATAPNGSGCSPTTAGWRIRWGPPRTSATSRSAGSTTPSSGPGRSPSTPARISSRGRRSCGI
jgi:nicotinamidase/pyrazinamidase